MCPLKKIILSVEKVPDECKNEFLQLKTDFEARDRIN